MAQFHLRHARTLFTSVAMLSLMNACGVRPDRDAPKPVAQTVTAPTRESVVGKTPGAPASVTTNATTLAPAGAATAAGTGETAPTAPFVQPTAPVIDWAYVNEKVITPSCLKCHTAARPAHGVSVETYAAVKASLDIINKVALIDKTMPKRNPLPEDQAQILSVWIAAGAPETVSSAADVTTPAPAAPVVIVREPVTPADPTTPAPTPLPPVVIPVPTVPTVPSDPIIPAPAPVPQPPVIISPAPTTPVVLDWATINEQVIKVSCVRCHSAPHNAGGINLETYASVKAVIDEINTSAIVEGSMPPRKPMPDDAKALLKAWIDAGSPETVPTR
ncbi:MAG: hypothetical protein H7249_03270 [Chitinophagaceae bacterium]|nr:hypothetical protein [Oligoflexus sp.]